MSNTSNMGSDFIEKATAIVLENVSNEQFGVSELAEVMNMSRSNLLRKIKKETQRSVSQFIRQVRLQKSMELLKLGTLTVSEISHQVGFGSTSYYIKCFREAYGYSPGEVGKGTLDTAQPLEVESSQKHFLKRSRWGIGIAASLVILIVLFFVFNKTFATSTVELEKSIAVLPFKNESSDSSNLYFVNGLMESALRNLQRIEDLRVISRTSVEKYRNTDKGIPEIAQDLNVNYLVEGSGQRVGDQVLLNIQLIEVSSDKPIWVAQYNREVGDIFGLQNEVAKKIADAIEAIVTPDELDQIEKKPTENLVAYDFYLQALDPYYSRTKEGLEKAIPLFEKAIENDPQFALAYADIAISYYFLDIYQAQKQYAERINNYADKALLYDAKSDISLIAKALYYMHSEEYHLALPHLEKALEYNPNSSSVVQMLADLYARSIPNTAKYLKYALKGIQLDIAANDSVQQSYIYLHLSNALIQTGFTDEAITYINKSLDYNQENYYAPYLKILIKCAKDKNIEKAKGLLIKEWKKDTTRLDILQEAAKFHFYQEDYEGAFFYFKKLVKAREKGDLNIYQYENGKIGMVYKKMGLDEKASEFFDSYAAFCEKEQSIYRSLNKAVKYVHEGKNNKAIEQLEIFATQNNFYYWIVLYMEDDPMLKPLKNHPEFDNVMQKIENRFWENQKQLKKSLEEQGLL